MLSCIYKTVGMRHHYQQWTKKFSTHTIIFVVGPVAGVGGLREAVTQVLQRNRYAPDLRLRVLSAPMMHRKRAATPFGDISTLAKGRLYATPGGGFEFVQEDEDRDCGPCGRCRRVLCEDIYSEDPTHLLALWTVKRLRHRTHHGGFNYETEYTISPVEDINEAIRDGRFDYSLPGHVFVIKQKEAAGSTFPDIYSNRTSS
ncbi:unnamed protein product [Acanthoscelides obtectus]|uniref:Uncharacterized protein n=1 Tax=Acanthoscelides obtectus TaxID=200917 RepID=A0A9P0JWA5_ACAOB|nr:unnamed protein product [Acanthoscelides obtectus]CAK1625321.1 hypothetical protein AOBTE_LOCUS3105 [Acanthoscelides obtectus]